MMNPHEFKIVVRATGLGQDHTFTEIEIRKGIMEIQVSEEFIEVKIKPLVARIITTNDPEYLAL
jgi:hypothetical protein